MFVIIKGDDVFKLLSAWLSEASDLPLFQEDKAQWSGGIHSVDVFVKQSYLL